MGRRKAPEESAARHPDLVAALLSAKEIVDSALSRLGVASKPRAVTLRQRPVAMRKKRKG